MISDLPPYPLREVLELKHRRVEQAEAVLKEKQRLLEIEEQKLKEREKERNKVKDHYQDKIYQFREELDAGTTSNRIEQSKIYLKVVLERLHAEEKKVKEQQQQVELAQKNVDIAKNQLKDRERERDKIKTHRKEWTKEMKKELALIETRLEDEIGTTMFLTKMIQKKQEKTHQQLRTKE